MTNRERIESIWEDLDGLNSTNVNELRQLFENDLRWLCEYVDKVENFINIMDNPSNQFEGTTYMGGYFSAIKDLKDELKDIK